MQDLLIRDDMFDAIIFDLDNTLVDFISAKQKACSAVIDNLGRGDPDVLFSYFRRGRYGFEDYGNIFDYLSDIGVSGSKEYLMSCSIYEEVKLSSLMPYPGIRLVLEKLRKTGLSLGVVTDADSDHASKRLEKAKIADLFDVVITPDISGYRKPHPSSFILALDSLRTEPFRAACVGDSIRRDIEPGRQLGMLTVHAAYGDWHPDETIASAIRTLRVECPEQLIHLFIGRENDDI